MLAYHFLWLLVVNESLQVSHNLPYTIIRHTGGVAGTYPFTTIHQHHRDNGTIPLWLNTNVVISEVLQLSIVRAREYESGQGTQHGEDISSREGGRGI